MVETLNPMPFDLEANPVFTDKGTFQCDNVSKIISWLVSTVKQQHLQLGTLAGRVEVMEAADQARQAVEQAREAAEQANAMEEAGPQRQAGPHDQGTRSVHWGNGVPGQTGGEPEQAGSGLQRGGRSPKRAGLGRGGLWRVDVTLKQAGGTPAQANGAQEAKESNQEQTCRSNPPGAVRAKKHSLANAQQKFARAVPSDGQAAAFTIRNRPPGFSLSAGLSIEELPTLLKKTGRRSWCPGDAVKPASPARLAAATATPGQVDAAQDGPVGGDAAKQAPAEAPPPAEPVAAL